MFTLITIVEAILIGLGAALHSIREPEEIEPAPPWASNAVREIDEVTAMLVCKMMEYAETPSINNKKYTGNMKAANNE